MPRRGVCLGGVCVPAQGLSTATLRFFTPFHALCAHRCKGRKASLPPISRVPPPFFARFCLSPMDRSGSPAEYPQMSLWANTEAGSGRKGA